MRSLKWTGLFAGASLAGSIALAACGDGMPPAAEDTTTNAIDGNPCAGTKEGCPCAQQGLQVSCGKVERRSGDYLTCSDGLQTCETSGRWSACIGDGLATRTISQGSGLHFSALATTATACVDNPCDPYCKAYVDTPQGIDAGSGLSATDAGLGLLPGDAGPVVACTGLTPMSTVNMVVTSLNPLTTSPANTTFTTSLTPSSCYSGTYAPLWGVSRYDLGTISGNGVYTHVVPVPATVAVTAYAGSFSTSANVKVTVAVTDVSGAPSGYTASSFTATPTSTEALPSILYPYDATIFPLGLSAPALMWKRAGTTVAKAVKVTLRFPSGSSSPTFLWSAIAAEGSLRYQIPQSAWTAFEQTAKGSTGSLEIQRIDSTNKLQNKSVVDVRFSTANLRGRIYYTQYQSGNGDIKIVLPYGSSAPTSAFSPPLANNCGVCHSMSPSGNKFVTSSEGSTYNVGYNTFGISNVNADGSLTPLHVGPAGSGDSRGLAFAPVTATGTYALLGNNWWGNINNGSSTTTPGTAGASYKIYQLPTTAGAATDVSNIGSGGTGKAWGLNGTTNTQMYVPAFSFDNKRMLYVNADTTGDASGATAAARQGISYFEFDEAAKKFQNRKLVVKTTSTGNPANQYIRFPAWETDSRSIMFPSAATSDDDGFNWYAGMNPSGCCGRIKVHGKLWSVDAGPIGGSPNSPVALDNINEGLGNPSPLGTDDTNRNYQPTMLGVSAGGFRWAVFTSVRAYGNLLNTSTAALASLTNKLWVAAIDDTTSGTVDRSHPAFFLPNQNANSSVLNERGYWSLDACKPADQASSTCGSNEECCGYSSTTSSSTAECRVDTPLSSPATFHCKSTVTTTCHAVGDTCGADADCCGFPSNRCVSGSCQTPPPIVPYAAANYTRDYTATCPPDKQLVWRFFDYKTVFPTKTGASIAFSAQTASTQAALTGMTKVALATQTATNTNYLGVDVSQALANATPKQKSLAWLRINVALSPSTDNLATPLLTDWRQAYDCVDAE